MGHKDDTGKHYAKEIQGQKKPGSYVNLEKALETSTPPTAEIRVPQKGWLPPGHEEKLCAYSRPLRGLRN